MSNRNDTRIIQPYLFFNGRCEEAVEFYRRALGAEVEMMMRFKESPEPAPPDMVPPGFENKIMHSSFRVGETTIMASDGCSAEKPASRGSPSPSRLPANPKRSSVFAALAEGGRVSMPLTKTFWSPCFGMLVDRFGVGWMVSVHVSRTALTRLNRPFGARGRQVNVLRSLQAGNLAPRLIRTRSRSRYCQD